MNPPKICTVCFIGVIVLGVGFVAIGLLLTPVLPYFQLDAVLSPKELADPQVRDVTLAILEKAGGNQWLMWSLAGVMFCAIGGVGLFALMRMHALPRKGTSRDEVPLTPDAH
jgi:hypothetical protein